MYLQGWGKRHGLPRLSLLKHVQLPEIPPAGVQKRVKGKFSGLADASFKEFQFSEFFHGVRFLRRLKARLSHQENPLRAYGQLKIDLEIADHIGNHLAAKP